MARLADSSNQQHRHGLLRALQLCEKFINSNAASPAALHVLREEVAKALTRPQQPQAQVCCIRTGPKTCAAEVFRVSMVLLHPALCCLVHCGPQAQAVPARTRKTYASKHDQPQQPSRCSSSSNGTAADQPKPAAAQALPTKQKQVRGHR